jgi:hypothetical protein
MPVSALVGELSEGAALECRNHLVFLQHLIWRVLRLA